MGALSPVAGRSSLSWMKDNAELYAAILGVRAPWHVTDVDVRTQQGGVTVMIEAQSSTPTSPPALRSAESWVGHAPTRLASPGHL